MEARYWPSGWNSRENISPWCPSRSIIGANKDDVLGGPYATTRDTLLEKSLNNCWWVEVSLTFCTTAFSLLLKTTSFLVLLEAGTNARISSPLRLSRIGIVNELMNANACFCLRRLTSTNTNKHVWQMQTFSRWRFDRAAIFLKNASITRVKIIIKFRVYVW